MVDGDIRGRDGDGISRVGGHLRRCRCAVRSTSAARRSAMDRTTIERVGPLAIATAVPA